MFHTSNRNKCTIYFKNTGTDICVLTNSLLQYQTRQLLATLHAQFIRTMRNYFISHHSRTKIYVYSFILQPISKHHNTYREIETHHGTCYGLMGANLVRFTDFPKLQDPITITTDELSKVRELIQGCTSLTLAVHYPHLAGFLIAPEHSASEGTSMMCCDWGEGGSGC